MASICDSCFTSDSGILAEASFPYDTAYADRLYCVGGNLVAPPSNGAVQSLWSEWSAEPLTGLVNFQPITLTGSSLSWTNLTGRTATVVVVADASLLSDTQPLGSYVYLGIGFTFSDGSTLGSLPLNVPLPTTASGVISPASVSGNSNSKSIPPGVSITISSTGSNFISPSAGTSSSIVALRMSVVLMGAI